MRLRDNNEISTLKVEQIMKASVLKNEVPRMSQSSYNFNMPKAPAAITSPSIKKLAQKAVKAPSLLTTAETRELGASVMAHLSPSQAASPIPAKKSSAKKAAAKKVPSKTAPPKEAPAKKTSAKSVTAKKVPAKRS